jgi:hypothetical protein
MIMVLRSLETGAASGEVFGTVPPETLQQRFADSLAGEPHLVGRLGALRTDWPNSAQCHELRLWRCAAADAERKHGNESGQNREPKTTLGCPANLARARAE